MQDEDIRNKISFDPLRSGGASFETKVLIKPNNHQLIFKHTTGYVLFSSAFFIIPIVVIFIILYKNSTLSFIDLFKENTIILIVTFLFLAVSGYLFYDLLNPVVFDKSIHRFYKGFKKNILKKSKNNIPLNQIIGIQIIGELVKSNDNSFKSYELNLILDDLTRINVIDHGNGKGIVHDAKTISVFLDIPIWYKNKDNLLIKQKGKHC